MGSFSPRPKSSGDMKALTSEDSGPSVQTPDHGLVRRNQSKN